MRERGGSDVRFRFVHAADLRLDAPFTGIRRVPPSVATVLRDASLEAFDALVSLAIAREAAFVVLAGGLYAGPQHGIRAQLALRRGLERLSRAGIWTCVALGPGDLPPDRWSAIPEWPERVHLLGPDRAGPVAIERDGQVLATVRRAGPRGEEPGLALGVLRTEAAPVDELRGAGLDYWALGGVPARRVLAEKTPWIAYPGTLQGRGHAPAERGAKGALVVEADGRTAGPPEFVALDRVRCATVTADVGGLGDVAGLTRLLGELAEDEAAQAERRSLLLRARLVGSGPVVGPLRRPGALADLLAGLRDARGPEEPFAWWDAVEDATSRQVDRDALRRRGDFTSALIDAADTLAADETSRAAFLERHLPAVPADLTRLIGALPEPVPQRIADLALDSLTSDD